MKKNTTKILSFVLVICILMSTSISASDTRSFKDVNIETEYYSDIMQLAEEGIITGDGTGSFNPDKMISIPEALTIIERKYGNPDNLPEKWEDWEDGRGYTATWFNASSILGEYTERYASYGIAGQMIIKALGFNVLPVDVYDMPYDFAAVNSFSAAYATCLIYGYESPIESRRDTHLGMSRAEFCNLVVWAEYLNDTDRYIPTMDYEPIIVPDIRNVKDQYVYDYYNVQLQSIFKILPEALLEDYNSNKYTVVLLTGDDYDSYVSQRFPKLTNSAGIYSHNWGHQGRIILSYPDKALTLHEFGHYVQFHHGSTSKVIALFENEDELVGVQIASGSDYCTTNFKEFFAEAFESYYLAPTTLQKHAPQTYQLVEDMLSKYMPE